jgi:hypothetical protein
MGRIYEVRHWDRLSCHDIKTASGIQKLREGKYIQTHRQQDDLINLHLNEENRLKNKSIFTVLFSASSYAMQELHLNRYISLQFTVCQLFSEQINLPHKVLPREFPL